MKWWAVSLLALALVLFVGYELNWFADASDREVCDMTHLVPGFYCDPCDRIRDASDLVSGVAFFECTACGRTERAPGACRDCGADPAPRTSGKNACPRCFRQAEPATLCVKTCFECPRCRERVVGPAGCEGCDRDFVRATVPALVQYQCSRWDCPECSYQPGKCANRECEHHGRPLVPCCTESGEFPHVKGDRREAEKQ